MVRTLYSIDTHNTDPRHNLALEEVLLRAVQPGQCTLYLWQNQRTVVIGRNQDAGAECRIRDLENDGGRLVRRLSGGGAVYHDLGNLNFTFLMSAEDYDLPRQLTVLERACQSLGIPAQRSGRNDLLADGRKFSGNAFYKHNGKAYHHGTLMVDVDLEMVQRYLSPSKAKLAAKGVDSVRSRVVNLREFVPTLTIPQLADALIAALAEVYAPTPVGAVIGRLAEEKTCQVCHSERSEESVLPSPVPPSPVLPLDVNELDLCALTEKYRSDAWLYGQKLPFTASVEDRFPWGGVELQLQVESGVIYSARVYTDAMDETLAGTVEEALTGCPFQFSPLSAAIENAVLSEQVKTDLLSLLRTAI